MDKLKSLVLALLGAGLLLSGCNKDTETLWGAYQEPVAPSPLPEAAGASEIRVLWAENLGSGADKGYALLQPAYGTDGIYAANRNGGVFKLAPENGATIWQRNLESDIFSGVGVGESIAAVALDNGTVVALDAESGEILWESPVNRQISAIPVVGKGRVIVRTADGMVIGLNAANGESAWFVERAVPGISIHGDSTPAISGDAVFVGLANGRLLANNVITGREYWETEVSFASGRNEMERLTDSDSSPLISAATLYTATYQGNVAALRLQDASVRWRAKVSTRLPMSLGAGRLLVTNELGEVVALDAESGDILWTQEIFRGHGMSRPLVINQRVVVGDSGGNIYSLDLADGTFLETRKTVTGAVVALVAGQDQFATFSSEGRISVLSLVEGRE